MQSGYDKRGFTVCGSNGQYRHYRVSKSFAASTADHLTGSGVKLRQCDMVDHIPEFQDGYLPVPEEPGIGIDVIPDLEEKFPFRPHKVMTRLNSDGSICDQ